VRYKRLFIINANGSVELLSLLFTSLCREDNWQGNSMIFGYFL
jgi:hypothetical protein